MRKIDSVLFDLGSTLIYFEGSRDEVLKEAGKQMYLALQSSGVNLDEGEFQKTFITELNRYYREREQDFVESTTLNMLQDLLKEKGYTNLSSIVIENALDAMYKVTQAHWHPDPDAGDVLSELKQKSYHLGIISNAADDKDVQALVDNAGLRKYFDFVLTSAFFGMRKPDPSIFKVALDRWHKFPSQAVMVGDKLGADIKGANKAGIFSIWVTRYADRPGNRKLIGVIEPDATISSLRELIPLIEKINQ